MIVMVYFSKNSRIIRCKNQTHLQQTSFMWSHRTNSTTSVDRRHTDRLFSAENGDYVTAQKMQSHLIYVRPGLCACHLCSCFSINQTWKLDEPHSWTVCGQIWLISDHKCPPTGFCLFCQRCSQLHHVSDIVNKVVNGAHLFAFINLNTRFSEIHNAAAPSPFKSCRCENVYCTIALICAVIIKGDLNCPLTEKCYPSGLLILFQSHLSGSARRDLLRQKMPHSLWNYTVIYVSSGMLCDPIL